MSGNSKTNYRIMIGVATYEPLNVNIQQPSVLDFFLSQSYKM